MDFVDKKEHLANVLDKYIAENSDKDELALVIKELKEDSDFNTKPLFMSIFHELETSLDQLTRKDLKQRSLMVRSFID